MISVFYWNGVAQQDKVEIAGLKASHGLLER
jgi:hypothetical protein